MPKICSSDIEFSESEFDVSAVARSISLERKSEVSEEDYSRNSGFDDILNSNDNDESVNSIVIKNSDRTKHKTISSTPKKRDNQDTPSKSSDICENNEIKNSQLLDELIITNENEGKSLDNINLDDFNSIYKSFFTSRGEKPTLSSNGRFI
ncbi:hypothetical protein K502DRAFT_325053 [Neoconidiobolus thromboides FSU 785]|nr:hypothetical protein K502DRAFT_325053 [Neoconidiobolus thromboides FSU 785]